MTHGQYRLIVDTRSTIEDILKQYAKATSYAQPDALKAQQLLLQSIRTITALQERYERYEHWFRKAWLSENQGYWLDNAAAPYRKKITDLQALRKNLETAADNVLKTHSLPSAASLRLNIAVNDRFYFKNWMLGGPFPLADTSLPSFLYSENAEYDIPYAGNFHTFLAKPIAGKSFLRWMEELLIRCIL